PYMPGRKEDVEHTGPENFEKYMRRALELAEMGRGTTNPNPMVGAVILKGDRVVGEGYHKRAGEPHAEIYALRNASEDVAGATMIVSLEPCNHFGRTPPCTEAIINAGIKKVVIGMIDPNSKCTGDGIKRLIDAGIEVDYGLLADEVARQNEVFIKYITTGRPFITVKAAISLDGKIAEAPETSTPITGEEAKKRVHELRNEYDAIMVGIGTVLADDPLLTTRLERDDVKNPTRIVVDSRARLPLSSRVSSTTRDVRTIVAATSLASPSNIDGLRAKGMEVLKLGSRNGSVDINLLLEELGRLEVSSVIVEGGGNLIASFVRANLVDKYLIFIAPKLIGERGVDFIGGKLKSIEEVRIERVERVGEDLLIEAYPR
ncbi:MAG TPA: bifunctional diaminohydroxyphosphoribosylaminopyrimidine deaminase/5-amino-6-(5-phosphoribosylamino)uracil reductase RibD, partial [Anaerolineae bacterium]|nr:bifunctional diaminohydroxyphosphoribosylaminopyrimidine deaminase/5-amino-6-(5-phosphoribosylamino)uracil reductase RibD [Anaerolineae bacterium]